MWTSAEKTERTRAVRRRRVRIRREVSGVVVTPAMSATDSVVTVIMERCVEAV